MDGVHRAHGAVTTLLEEQAVADSSSNLFLCWPRGLHDLELFLPFVATVTAQAGLASGAGGPEAGDAPATAFPFHPRMMGETQGPGPLRQSLRGATAPAVDYRFASPFPMLHVIPAAELQRARTKLGSRAAAHGAHLLDRNARRMREATGEDYERWELLLRKCREGV